MLIFYRINPGPVIARHFATFYDDQSKKTSWLEIFALSIVIVAGGVSFYFFNPKIYDAFQSSMLNFYAIVGGFLVSALFVVTNHREISQTSGRGIPKDEIDAISKLRGELFSNLSFGVLLAFLGAGMCVLLAVNFYPRITGAIIVGAFILFGHTLLVVIKRLDNIFRKLE